MRQDRYKFVRTLRQSIRHSEQYVDYYLFAIGQSINQIILRSETIGSYYAKGMKNKLPRYSCKYRAICQTS